MKKGPGEESTLTGTRRTVTEWDAVHYASKGPSDEIAAKSDGQTTD
jgi:hypothetical protein